MLRSYKSKKGVQTFQTVTPLIAFSTLALLAVSLFSPLQVYAAPSAPDKKWQFRVGGAYRLDTQVKSEWRNDFIRSKMEGYYRHVVSGNADIGTMNGYANRDYTDGYVYIDAGTADPDTFKPGYTWFWGYDNSSQYSGDSVAFHSESAQELHVNPVAIEDRSNSDSIDQAGLDLLASRILFSDGDLELKLNCGITWYPERESQFQRRGIVARQYESEWRYVDTYSAPYTPFPDAPYSNEYEGPGYLLKNIPDSREKEVMNSSSANWRANSEMDLKLSVWDLRLGPNICWNASERFSIRIGAQLRATYVDTEMNEINTILAPDGESREFRNKVQDGDWIFGWGAEAGVDYQLARSWFIGISAMYDQWSEDVQISGDAFDADVELGEWSVTAGLGWEF